jgi:hypothetical protein
MLKGLIASHQSVHSDRPHQSDQKSFSLRVVVVIYRRFESDPPRIGIEVSDDDTSYWTPLSSRYALAHVSVPSRSNE